MDKQLSTLKLELTSPMKVNFDVEFNKLTLLTGYNASGKSLILKSAFFISTLAEAVSHLRTVLTGEEITTEVVNGISSSLFSHVFDSVEEFNGSIQGTWDNCSLKASIVNGKTETLEYVNPEELKYVPQIRYMSTNIRLFSDIKRYLQLRSTKLDTNTHIMIEHMLKYYKLYDVKDVETLIQKTEYPLKVPDQVNSFFEQQKSKINTIKVDLAQCDFILTHEDGSKKLASALSNGEQAMLHMFLSSSLN